MVRYQRVRFSMKMVDERVQGFRIPQVPIL